MAAIAANWKVLSGIENNWEGLLDPIDDDLRYYLIKYGGLTTAPADSFNDVKASDAYSLCRYPPEVLFTRVGLQIGNPFKYQVTDYFYARSELDFKEWLDTGVSSFIGFVAVATDEGKIVLGRRDIVVCWRGTTLPIEWFQDFDFGQVVASDIFKGSQAQVHEGFYHIYTTQNSASPYTKTSARDQVKAALKRLLSKYSDLKEDVSITVVGYSLGAALATLNAMDIVANGYHKPSGSGTGYPVTAFVYACPRVGDKGFADVFTSLTELHMLRIKNADDLFPELPPKQILQYEYEDVGVELDIDTAKSTYIKGTTFLQPHDLNLYLHGIAGYQGQSNDFKLVVDLDIALVNKYNDLLKESYKVPPKWWSNVINYGMAQMDDGSWKLHDYVPDPPIDDEADENGAK